MSAPEAVPETVVGLAAGWFARRRSGEMSAQEAQELEAWLELDPAHRAAFEAVGRSWAGVGVTRDAPEILAIRARARRKPVRRGRVLALRAMAASVAAAVVGVGLWAGVERGTAEFRRFPTQSFHTGVGQRTTMTLPDGSVVTLDTDTVLRTRSSHGQRLVYLDRGQAFFRVAHDPSRPFIVAAAGRTVTAVGTAFDVRVDRGRFEVTLVEGKVKVDTPASTAHPGAAPHAVQTTEMLAGNQFSAADDQRWSVSRADTAKEISWITGWLKFDDEPLGQVVEEFARYSPRKIVLDDPALAATPVSGRFQAEDVDAFVRALQAYRIARVEDDTPAVVRLAAP